MGNEYLQHRMKLKLADKVVEVKPQKGIPKQSEKMKEEMKKYSPERVKFLKANPVCKGDLPGCKKVATTIHHSVGRVGEDLHDQKFWVPMCLPCHIEIHTNELLAKTTGLSKSRLKKRA